MTNKTIGWQDILIEVPSNWQMTFTKTKVKKKLKNKTGLLTFWESSKKMLELRWIIYKFNEKPTTENTIKDYIKSLKSSYKSFYIRIQTKGQIFNHPFSRIVWGLKDKKLTGIVTVWVCTKSYKVVICQSQHFEKPNEEMSQIKEILSTLRCHDIKKFSKWTGPNLNLSTPIGMTLQENQFLIGLSYLHLKGMLDEFPFNIIGNRFGLANQKISDPKELPNWYKDYIESKKIYGISSHYKINSFERFLFKQEKIIWKDTFITKKSKFSKNLHFETYLWINEEKNDIYVIIFYGDKKAYSVAANQIDEIIKVNILNN